MRQWKWGDKALLGKEKKEVIFLGYPDWFRNPFQSLKTIKDGAVVIGKGYAVGILVRLEQLQPLELEKEKGGEVPTVGGVKCGSSSLAESPGIGRNGSSALGTPKPKKECDGG